jgi:hypothetical protein
MNSNQKIASVEIKTLFSTIWVFVLLNMIFRDIHEMPYSIEEWMTQAANGPESYSIHPFSDSHQAILTISFL